jgi:hypothetical protein
MVLCPDLARLIPCYAHNFMPLEILIPVSAGKHEHLKDLAEGKDPTGSGLRFSSVSSIAVWIGLGEEVELYVRGCGLWFCRHGSRLSCCEVMGVPYPPFVCKVFKAKDMPLDFVRQQVTCSA